MHRETHLVQITNRPSNVSRGPSGDIIDILLLWCSIQSLLMRSTPLDFDGEGARLGNEHNENKRVDNNTEYIECFG